MKVRKKISNPQALAMLEKMKEQMPEILKKVAVYENNLARGIKVKPRFTASPYYHG